MKTSSRFLLMTAIALVLGVLIYFVGQQKSDNQKLFMGVDGDPRMTLCDSPLNGELADHNVLAAMAIDTPLVKKDSDRAAYRLSVLRPKAQESLSILFTSPADVPGRYQISHWDGAHLKTAKGTLDEGDSALLIFALEDAKIWGQLKRTIESLARAGPATAVVEVQAPGRSRCITTRYDDERVRPLLAAFAKKLGEQAETLPLDGIVAPEVNFLTGSAKPTVTQGQ